MRQIITKYGSLLISLVLAICVCVSFHFFITHYSQCMVLLEQEAKLTKRFEFLKQKQNEILKRNRIFTKIKTFVMLSENLGLSKDKWSEYAVAIDEPVTFAEFSQIINQCVNTPAYYFKPVSLHAKPVLGTDKPPAPKKQSPPAGGVSTKKTGDINLILQGKFIARKN